MSFVANQLIQPVRYSFGTLVAILKDHTFLSSFQSVMLAHMALDVALNAIAMLFIRKNRQNAMQLMAIAPVKRDGREKDVHEVSKYV